MTREEIKMLIDKEKKKQGPEPLYVAQEFLDAFDRLLGIVDMECDDDQLIKEMTAIRKRAFNLKGH